MIKRHGFTLIELMTVVVIVGVLAAIAIPNYLSMQSNAKEANVKSNAHTVQLVAEDYAVRHDGDYSAAAADLLPLLPGGQLLENGFTSLISEPHFGSVASVPGEVGIVEVFQDGLVTGYSVSGFGKDQMILTLVNGS